MYYDCHVHSKFSPDGSSDIGEFCSWLDEEKLSAIGFAEHLDFLPECGAYGYLNYTQYMNTISKYREMGYSFYAGVEIDYAKSVENEIRKRLEEEKYDFTICSIHMVNGVSVSDRDIEHFYERRVFEAMIEGYYNQLKYALQVDAFDVMGHIGVFKRYLKDDFYDEKLKAWLEELDLEVAKFCAHSDKIIEVNSSGLFAVSGSSVPGVNFLKEYHKQGGRKICMSSDAHNAKNAGQGFGIVADILMEIGFEHVYLPWDKENRIRLR